MAALKEAPDPTTTHELRRKALNADATWLESADTPHSNAPGKRSKLSSNVGLR
jgi:hypothetical protein